MFAIVTMFIVLSFLYWKMYQESEMKMVWAVQAKDPILHPLFEGDTPIVYDVDLSDWHGEDILKALDSCLEEAEGLIQECASINGYLPMADDADLTFVTYEELFGAVNEDRTLNSLLYRNVA